MPRPAAPPPRALLIDADAAFLADLHAESGIGLMRLEQATGGAHALRLLRTISYDVVLTSPKSAIAEDLALLEEMQLVRPWVKAIVLAPVATPEEVIAALKVHAFACFTAPFSMSEIAAMIRRAVQNPDWKDGLQVVSARPVVAQALSVTPRRINERHLAIMAIGPLLFGHKGNARRIEGCARRREGTVQHGKRALRRRTIAGQLAAVDRD
jgi:DNA-binding NtrC family response regulator